MDTALTMSEVQPQTQKNATIYFIKLGPSLAVEMKKCKELLKEHGYARFKEVDVSGDLSRRESIMKQARQLHNSTNGKPVGFPIVALEGTLIGDMSDLVIWFQKGQQNVQQAPQPQPVQPSQPSQPQQPQPSQPHSSQPQLSQPQLSQPQLSQPSQPQLPQPQPSPLPAPQQPQPKPPSIPPQPQSNSHQPQPNSLCPPLQPQHHLSKSTDFQAHHDEQQAIRRLSKSLGEFDAQPPAAIQRGSVGKDQSSDNSVSASKSNHVSQGSLKIEGNVPNLAARVDEQFIAEQKPRDTSDTDSDSDWQEPEAKVGPVSVNPSMPQREEQVEHVRYDKVDDTLQNSCTSSNNFGNNNPNSMLDPYQQKQQMELDFKAAQSNLSLYGKAANLVGDQVKGLTGWFYPKSKKETRVSAVEAEEISFVVTRTNWANIDQVRVFKFYNSNFKRFEGTKAKCTYNYTDVKKVRVDSPVRNGPTSVIISYTENCHFVDDCLSFPTEETSTKFLEVLLARAHALGHNITRIDVSK